MSKEKAARVQETTSLPTSAPAKRIIRSLASKGIGNCTILLSIQIDVNSAHLAKQSVCLWGAGRIPGQRHVTPRNRVTPCRPSATWPVIPFNPAGCAPRGIRTVTSSKDQPKGLIKKCSVPGKRKKCGCKSGRTSHGAPPVGSKRPSQCGPATLAQTCGAAQGCGRLADRSAGSRWGSGKNAGCAVAKQTFHGIRQGSESGVAGDPCGKGHSAQWGLAQQNDVAVAQPDQALLLEVPQLLVHALA